MIGLCSVLNPIHQTFRQHFSKKSGTNQIALGRSVLTRFKSHYILKVVEYLEGF
jgi:hypothetical protein